MRTSDDFYSCYNRVDLSCRLIRVYLDDVNWLLCVLLEQQHCGSVGVNVKPLQELSAVCVTLIHMTKADIVSKGKSRQLKEGIR